MGVVVSLAVAFGAAGCSKEEEGSAAEADPPEEQPAPAEPLASCLEGVEAAAGDPASPRELVAGCSAACPAFAELPADDPSSWGDALASCGYLCPAAEELEAPEPHEVVEACGADHYGLTAEEAAFLSPEWFVLQRLGAYFAEQRDAAPAELVAELDSALAEPTVVELPVPVAFPDRYDLPPASAGEPAEAEVLLWIEADELRLGAPAKAELTPRGARLDASAFSGREVEAEDLADEIPAGASVLLLADASTPARRIAEVAASLEDHRARLGIDVEGRTAASRVVLGAGGGGGAHEVALEGSELSAKGGGASALADEEAASGALAAAEIGDAGAVLVRKGSAADLATLLERLASADVRTAALSASEPKEPAKKPAAKKPAAKKPKRSGPRFRVRRVKAQGAPAGFLRRSLNPRAALLRCYEKRAAESPGLEGAMDVKLESNARGRVKDVRASGIDAKLGMCVAEAYRKVRFGPKGANASVQFQLRIDP